MLADGEPVITALGHSAQIIVVDAEVEPRCSERVCFCGDIVTSTCIYLCVKKYARCSEIRRQSVANRVCSLSLKG